MTIRDAITYYKENIEENWNQEKYKWIAVQHFQDNWNADAEDFPVMLKESLSLAYNLLGGGMYMPNKMICLLAKQYPEKVREMFIKLFDESLPFAERIKSFKTSSKELLNDYQEKHPEDTKAKNHYQDLRAICVYLSFMYPDKYFLYKSRMYTSFKKLIDFQENGEGEDYEVKNYNNYARMCQEILNEIDSDAELKDLQRNLVASDAKCYADPSFHLLAQTIIFVFNYENSDESKKDTTLAGDDIETRYWLYSPGRGASIWDECYDNGFMAIGWDEIGDLTEYDSKDAMKKAMKEAYDPSLSYTMDAHATWQFANEMKPGDVVFAKKGLRLIIGRGIVESEYEYDPTREQYRNVRKVNWTHKGEWKHPSGQAAMKTLTDVSPYTDYIVQLNSLFEDFDEEPSGEFEIDYPTYTSKDFLNDVYMDEESYETLVALVKKKKNVILQGAPGVGKTYAAKRLAYSIMGVKNPNRVLMVQFHQSYSYEDFIMGFRPSESGFELKRGAFYDFCKEAEIDSDNEYFFIIDEINRGNLSKIFGELFMLIESDKRGVELQLLYSDEKFSVPRNVYIIGMMNTADRSLAMLDYALRRRFAFYDIKPGFETDGFREYRQKLNSDKFNQLVNCVENLNAAISVDDSLGEGFCIGHSYFCNLKKVTDQELSSIVEFELIPLLKEYWFDEPVKVKDWSNNLRSAIK